MGCGASTIVNQDESNNKQNEFSDVRLGPIPEVNVEGPSIATVPAELQHSSQTLHSPPCTPLSKCDHEVSTVNWLHEVLPPPPEREETSSVISNHSSVILPDVTPSASVSPQVKHLNSLRYFGEGPMVTWETDVEGVSDSGMASSLHTDSRQHATLPHQSSMLFDQDS